MPETRVSVIMPARDAARYLREAIASILEQDGADVEIIVVDDGSTDGTAALAAELGARVLRQEPAGAAAARNRGVRAARGELLAFLDADDVWASGGLRARLEALRAPERPDLVWGHVRHFISPDVPSALAARLFCPPGADVAHLAGGMLATRAAVERVGPFATHLRVGEFIEWMLRARECRLRETVIDDVVLWRRVHGASLTARNRGAFTDVAHALKASLDRRRALEGRAP